VLSTYSSEYSEYNILQSTKATGFYVHFCSFITLCV
jgi:hypothetical protein